MKIIIIARGYPTNRYPMNGIFEYDQAKALVGEGHKVIYLALDLRSIRRKRKIGIESFIRDGINIECINIPCGKLHKVILRTIRFLALKYLYNYVLKKYNKPDIVHSHFLEISYTVGQVFVNKDIPLVMTEHLSSLNKSELTNYIKKIGKNTYSKFDEVIVVGKKLKENLFEHFNIKAKVIPNIVDLSTFNYIDNKLRDKNKFKIVSVGSLNKRKDMLLLVESFSELIKKYNNCELIIYGEGSEKEKIKEKIKECNLNESVYLRGLKPRNEISENMANADCFALASQVETFGVAYIEAMAMGLPVIATKSGGPENFMNKEVGLLIQPKNKNELVEALFYMYDNSSKYNKKYINDYVKERFSSKIIGQKITNLYFNLIK